MPVVTEAHLEARRQQILDAASACFSRDGFHRTTMQSICSESRLSPGAVYRYFRSKEDIILAMCEGELRRNLAIIEHQAAREDTRLILSGLADVFFRLLDEDSPASCRVNVEIWAEALRNPEVGEYLRSRVDYHLDRFAALVTQGQQRSEINRRLDPSAVARTMLSTFYGLVLQKALDPGIHVPSYVESLKALYLGEFWSGKEGQEP